MAALRDLGIADPGEGHRHQGGGHGQRDQGEQQAAVRVGKIEGERTDAAGAPGHDHVDREDLAPVVRRRLVVEPALHDHELAGDAVADEDPEEEPGIGRVEDQVEEGGVARDDREDAERTDVPDPVDDLVAGERAGEEPDEIGGRDQSDELGGNAPGGELNPDERRQGAERQLDEGDADQHRNHRSDHRDHVSAPRRPPSSPALPGPASPGNRPAGNGVGAGRASPAPSS